jgi:hypothetical protein
LPPGGGRLPAAGGWLVTGRGLTDGPRYIFAAKGNKTSEFYRYEIATGLWTPAAPIPLGTEAKLPGKGCKAVADDADNVYMVKGNNSRGFWRYNSAANTWTPMPDVPLGSTNKKVKDGTDLAFVQKGTEKYVYFLKGYKDEFWRFHISEDSGGQWEPLQGTPVNMPAYKTTAGSWIELVEGATDAGPYIYLHKAKHHQLYKYDVERDSWLPGMLTGMPFIGRSGKSKKSKDGGSAAAYGGRIYSLKGGNTCEFWRYNPATAAWDELDTIPQVGADGKKKRVKAGGDIVHVGGGAFFVTKGNKSSDCWRMVVADAKAKQPSSVDGAVGRAFPTGDLRFSIAPNPLRAGFVTVRLAAGHDRNVGCFGSCPKAFRVGRDAQTRFVGGAEPRDVILDRVRHPPADNVAGVVAVIVRPGEGVAAHQAVSADEQAR